MTSARSSQETIALFEKYVIPNYRRYPISLVRGEGSHVWDAEGNRYLDLFPGWGCNILGYGPPRVVQAIQEQAARLIHVPNTWYTEPQGEFAEALCTRGFGQAFFCNSGAEAVEGAIKLARLHTPKEKYKIITFENGFHGRTLAAVTATAQPKYHEGLGPLVAGFSYAPHNDLEAVKKLIDHETAAILIEPVQGEGGVNLPADGFLAGLRELCDEHGMLLVFDEVQTGMGLTGSWWVFQQLGVEPDIFAFAKKMQVGGIAVNRRVEEVDRHAFAESSRINSTWGGNLVDMVRAQQIIETMVKDDLIGNARTMGERLVAGLREIESGGLISNVRGRGMMIAFDLPDGGTRDKVVQAAYENHLMALGCGTHSIRLRPFLDVQVSDVEEVLTKVEESVSVVRRSPVGD
jgi:acetylornithine/N-succinyldiaminopimelate aminotransferase